MSDADLELSNTGVFEAIGTPHLPPGPLMVAEASASAAMLEQDRLPYADYERQQRADGNYGRRFDRLLGDER